MEEREVLAEGLTGNLREIITKAVCGSGKKYFRYANYLKLPDNQVPTQILGTSVTQLKMREPAITPASQQEDTGIKVTGTYELNVWYSYNNSRGTDIAREIINFEEAVPLSEYDNSSISLVEARALVIKTPQCIEASVERDNRIKVEVEVGFFVEIVGETKIRVRVYPLGETS